MTRARAALIFVCLGGGLGCGHAPEGPAGAAGAFGAALARGDLRSAYRLTSSDFQTRASYDAFAAALADGGEPAALGQRLVAEAPRIPPRVEVELALGEQVPLVLEAGGWRVDWPVYQAWGQETPRAAVRTFVRALDARRYDVVLRVIPDRYRAGLSVDRLRAFWEGAERDAHRALLEQIRAAVTAPLVETGDEARLPIAAGREVHLVREAGLWKVENPAQD
jgi:hypothetical protein